MGGAHYDTGFEFKRSRREGYSLAAAGGGRVGSVGRWAGVYGGVYGRVMNRSVLVHDVRERLRRVHVTVNSNRDTSNRSNCDWDCAQRCVLCGAGV